MFREVYQLLLYYCSRPDLQKAFPEVKEGKLKELLKWASYASQNLFEDSNAYEFLKQNSNFYYYASRYENFLPQSDLDTLPKLFLIFGAGRSGTTLLKRIMNCHSMTSCLEEGFVYNGINNPLLFKLERIFESKKSWIGLKCPAMTDCLLDDNYVAVPIKDKTDEISKNFRNLYTNQPIIFLIRDVRDRISSVINLARLTNSNLSELPRLYEYWIDRNPFIQKNFREEILKIKKFENKLHGLLALEWKVKNTSLFVYKERGYPLLDIKYEDLVSNKGETMRKVTSFLDIPFENSMLDFHKKPHPNLKSEGTEHNFDKTRRDADKNSIGLHQENLTQEQTSEIMEISSDMMKKLNY